MSLSEPAETPEVFRAARERYEKSLEPEPEPEPEPVSKQAAPPESTRKALAAFLTSEKGVKWTLEKALEAAEVKKQASFVCPKCRYRSHVEITDANGSVNALKFMHEWGLTRPKDDGDALPNVKSLRDLTPKQVERLREIVYPKLKQELPE